MSDTPEKTVIAVENVTKVFPLRLKQVSLRHETQHALRNLFGRGDKRQTNNDFYALRNVSFEVQRGESVAIMGRNGSGKTTLLRLLANIMRPSEGHVRVDGRFTALIALGAGFLPDLTGRENIYLNAAMYGVQPDEIIQYVEEIIAFAELGTFIDAPIKDYSTGMNARLGFSIAVHILPEIVFIDEALSVGDQAFQVKCQQKIDELVRGKRTIVIVSHAPSTMRQLCQRGIWLNEGHIMMDDDIDTTLAAYDTFLERGGVA